MSPLNLLALLVLAGCGSGGHFGGKLCCFCVRQTTPPPPVFYWKQSQTVIRKEKRHMNLRKSSGHRPGVPGTPSGTNTGLPAGVPGISCCLPVEKATGKGNFAGTPTRYPRDTRPSRAFSEIYVIFSYMCFLLPNNSCPRRQDQAITNWVIYFL